MKPKAALQLCTPDAGGIQPVGAD